MHIHIIGVCGTFMGGLAVLAKQLGHRVTGSDQNVYPPMSTQLAAEGIELMAGYRAENVADTPDVVVIGNALSRGNPEVEAVLDKGLEYLSGPEWLAKYVLKGKWVLAVAGTHGKTTTTSMLAWVLADNGLAPGFLVGGIPLNFGLSARLGGTDFFVIEADEYDSAFFDKRSKFVHYHPRTLVMNNLEYDHADIFPDLEAIKKQFHHLVRTVPGQGLIISPAGDGHLNAVLDMGCWTPVIQTAVAAEAAWQAELHQPDGSEFYVSYQGQLQGKVAWGLTGRHNVANALSAIAAAHHVGVVVPAAIASLARFKNVKRRMEVLVKTANATLYDDFAHHPTAIATTLDGLRQQVGADRIIAIVEPRSNTMRMGIHTESLAHSLLQADLAVLFQPEDLGWNLNGLTAYADNLLICHTLDEIIAKVQVEAASGGHFVLMSNGGFGGIHQRLSVILQQITPN